jgi:hypothetical protein
LRGVGESKGGIWKITGRPRPLDFALPAREWGGLPLAARTTTAELESCAHPTRTALPPPSNYTSPHTTSLPSCSSSWPNSSPLDLCSISNAECPHQPALVADHARCMQPCKWSSVQGFHHLAPPVALHATPLFSYWRFFGWLPVMNHILSHDNNFTSQREYPLTFLLMFNALVWYGGAVRFMTNVGRRTAPAIEFMRCRSHLASSWPLAYVLGQ